MESPINGMPPERGSLGEEVMGGVTLVRTPGAVGLFVDLRHPRTPLLLASSA
jgi:hypothetical protein